MPENGDEDWRPQDPLPSIDELMSNLSSTYDGRENAIANAQRAEVLSDAGGDGDMIAPELIAPEEFDGVRPPVDSDENTGALLVFLNRDQPIRYPLYKEVITIGRAETADIRIDGDFISRIHARVLTADGSITIEDAGSKNGIQVNRRKVSTRVLEHGDVVSIGKLLFAFVDIPGADSSAPSE